VICLKKLKIVLSVIAFAAMLVAAVFAYNFLSERADFYENIVETENDFERAPDFLMENAQGNEIRLSDFQGKPVVLNFWTTWCPACVTETPHFENLYSEMGDEIQILKVNLIGSRGETREHAEAFMQERGYTLPLHFDTFGEGSQTFGVRRIPITFFITPDGYIAATSQGTVDEQTLRSGVDLITIKN
jgi:peroxiredoxin